MIDLTDNIILHYKLNDSASTSVVLDSAGRSNGSLQVDSSPNQYANTEDHAVTGRVNGGLWFDGETVYINTNDALTAEMADAFTISMWIQPDSVTPDDDQCLIGGGTDECFLQLLLRSDGSLDAALQVPAGLEPDLLTIRTAAAVLTEAAWHHVVVVVSRPQPDASAIAIYLDNEAIAESGTKSIDIRTFDSTVTQHLGSFSVNDCPGTRYTGSLDNVMIFNAALSAPQISMLYNNAQGTEVLVDPEHGILTDVEDWAITTLTALADDTGRPLFKNIVYGGNGTFIQDPTAEKCVDHWAGQIGPGDGGIASFDRYAPFAFVRAGIERIDREGDYDANLRIVLTVAVGTAANTPGDARLGAAAVTGLNRIFEKVFTAFDNVHPGGGLVCDPFYLDDAADVVSHPKRAAMQLRFAANWIPVS